MIKSHLRLCKGHRIYHVPTKTHGVIIKSRDPFLYVEKPDGQVVELPYFPCNFYYLSKKEYEARVVPPG